MIITYQTDVVLPNSTTILAHDALNAKIREYLVAENLNQQHYIVKGSALYLHIFLNKGNNMNQRCVIVKY